VLTRSGSTLRCSAIWRSASGGLGRVGILRGGAGSTGQRCAARRRWATSAMFTAALDGVSRLVVVGLRRWGSVGRRGFRRCGSGGRCARIAKQLYGGEKGCQSIGGRRLEERVLGEVFVVLQPAALAATSQAPTDAERAHAATLQAFEPSVERTRYETDRARRQYDAVEPENRLVARTPRDELRTSLLK